MTVKTLEKICDIRKDIAKMPESGIVSGVKIETEFLVEFGRQGRNSRHLLKMNGKIVGFFEEYVPWNIFKESTFSYILDVELKKKTGKCCENPYSEPLSWSPCLDNSKEAVKTAKSYKLI